MADFAIHRFDSERGWATPQGHFLRQDGTYSPKPVAFWNNVRHRAMELLGPDASPADDYAMTEVVHCKSKSDAGVKEAAPLCASVHLGRIVGLSRANLLVVLGAKARARATDHWDLGARFGTQKAGSWVETDNLALVEVAGRQRVVAYLWHPTGATAPKTFAKAYPLYLPLLQSLVRDEIDAGEFLGTVPQTPFPGPR